MIALGIVLVALGALVGRATYSAWAEIIGREQSSIFNAAAAVFWAGLALIVAGVVKLAWLHLP